jgi:hypothetical protein
MASERGKQLALGVLLVALVFIVYWQMRPQTAVPAATPSNPRASRSAGRGARGEVPDVQIEALKQERATPGETSRNLFRFKPPPAPPRPPQPPAQPPQQTEMNRPPAVPQVPPIALRFIGIVEDDKGKLAALADDRAVYYGREGQDVEGRYRIVSIGEQSIVMEHIDGRGRQTIPLSNRQ